MTETEWLSYTDPTTLLNVVKNETTKRKLCLYALACANQVKHLLTDPRSIHVIEVAEMFLDDLATEKEFSVVRGVAAAVADIFDYAARAADAADAAAQTVWAADIGSRIDVTAWAVNAAIAASDAMALARWCPNAIWQQCNFIRDIWGSPVPTIHPLNIDLRWNNGCIITLVNDMYCANYFDKMLLLGDMLEDAGCNNVKVLNHCRNNEQHVKGCWVIDLIVPR